MQILVYVRLSSADTRSPQPYRISIITTHVVITRKICRYNEKRRRYITRKDVVLTRKICHFNEKRSRYYEKICRFNKKRSRYNEKICCFNEKRSRYYEKRSRYYEKRSRYNEKRSRYNDIIEWKKYYVWAVLRHRIIQTHTSPETQHVTVSDECSREPMSVQFILP